MAFIPQLATIAVVLLLACISPGPDFVAVTSQSLVDRRSGLRMALGIATAIVVWATVTIAGLALILARVDGLYEIIRLVGAGYLLYLGIQLLITSWRNGHAAHAVTTRASRGSVRRGFVIGITNPKSAAFFSSLFATVLPVDAPVWVYLAAIAIAGIVATGWFSILAIMFSVGRVQSLYQGARRWIDAIMGGVLSAIGLRLALSR